MASATQIQTDPVVRLDLTLAEAKALKSHIQNYLGGGEENPAVRKMRESIFDSLSVAGVPTL